MKRRWKILIGVVVVLAVLLTVNTIVVENQTKSAEVTVEGGRILSLPGGNVQIVDSGGTAELPPRGGTAVQHAPIVLIHCYTCSLRWWDRMVPLMSGKHRVIRVDLLGHGGSEKPKSGYSMESQAQLVAGALNELDVQGAVVVGHSTGFDVAAALAEQSSELVDRLVDIGEAPDNELLEEPFIATLAYVPVIGEAAWRLTPGFAIKKGYEDELVAPDFDLESGFEDPDQVVDDFRAMTYTSFESIASEQDDFVEELPLDERVRATAVPLMVIFGEEDQTWEDPQAAADGFRDVPGARVVTIDGAGHSPNVEKPEETAGLILDFAADAAGGENRAARGKQHERRADRR